MRNILKKDEPDINIGTHCILPYECDFKDHCWAPLPENSIFEISGMQKKKKFNLYNKGITQIQNIPEHFPLTDKQKIQFNATAHNQDHIDKEKLQEFLNKLYYPLYFLDFESLQIPIPRFRNSHPYQQIPFQYSVHWLNNPAAVLGHNEFLAIEGKDPRKLLAKSLIKHIPGNACILSYNAGFEKSIIKTLADLFPWLKTRLMKIHDNTQDLIVPFEKYYLYTKDMHGSHSIKKVLPALIPEIDYADLKISDGETATRIYETLHTMQDESKKAAIKSDLLKYCKLDTYAMVRIVEKIRELV
jgi:hypothetical protein